MTYNSWAIKHRPETLDDVQGHGKAIRNLKDWADDWSRGDSPWLLHGPPGMGKTTVAKALAKYMERPISEINASDTRGSDDVERMAAGMLSGESLVFLDEVDSWPSRTNLTPLKEALTFPNSPTILAANEVWNVPDSIRDECNEVKFSLSSSSRKSYLRDVADAEDVEIDEEDLARIAEAPDLRSAINDLQLYATSEGPPGRDGRDWEVGNFEAMDQFIQKGDSDVGMSPRDLIPWLDENYKKDARGLEAALVYDTLSRADLHLARGEPGDYRSWRWASSVTELIPELLENEPYQGYIKWKFPEAFGVMKTSETIKAFAEEYSYSGSLSEIRNVVIPAIRAMPKERRCRLAEAEELSDDALPAIDLEPSDVRSYVVEEDATEGTDLPPASGNVMEDDW